MTASQATYIYIRLFDLKFILWKSPYLWGVRTAKAGPPQKLHVWKWLGLFSIPWFPAGLLHRSFPKWVLCWVLEEGKTGSPQCPECSEGPSGGESLPNHLGSVKCSLLSGFQFTTCSWTLRKAECERRARTSLRGRRKQLLTWQNPWNLYIVTSYSCTYQPQYPNDFVIKLKPPRTTRFQNMNHI